MSLTCFLVFFGCLGFHTYIPEAYLSALSSAASSSSGWDVWEEFCNGSAELHTYIRTYMHTHVHTSVCRDDQKIRAPYIHQQWKLHKRLPLLPRFRATSGRLLGTIHFCFLWTAFRRQIWAVHFLWRRSCTSEAVQGSLRRFNKIPN